MRSMEDNYAWNGRTIAVLHGSGEQRSDSDLIHDIAHYMLCPAKRRSKPEFGLGDNPDIECKHADELLPTADAQAEEEQASLLGILIEKQLGLDWQVTWSNHMWDTSSHDPFMLLEEFKTGRRHNDACLTLAKLLRRRQITKSCTPRVML